MSAGKLLLSAGAGIALGVAGLLAADQPGEPASPEEAGLAAQFPHKIETFERFPNVELTTHNGEKVRFFDDLVKDKIVAINFFYVACTSF